MSHQGEEGGFEVYGGSGRSRTRAVATALALLVCGAGTYRMTHDILRVRADGDGASIALALDEKRAPDERRDGVVLLTNEVLQRLNALRVLAERDDALGRQARDASAQALLALRR